MTSWQLLPDGINTTITATEEKVQAFSTATANLATTVAEPLATGSGFDGIVNDAVIGFLQEQSAGRLTAMITSCQNTMSCTADAATAYLQGDEQMAVTTMAATSNTTTPAF